MIKSLFFSSGVNFVFLDMKNTSKVTDFYFLSVTFRGIRSLTGGHDFGLDVF